MNTSVNTGFVSTPVTAKQEVRRFNMEPFWEYLEESRFGMTPLFLVIGVCLGGFAAAVAVQYSLLLLMLVGLSTGLVAIMLISVMSMRVTFWLLVTAILIDLFVYFL